VFVFLRHFYSEDYDMASIRRRGDGWQAQICVGGVRRSATLPTKRAAAAWAAAQTVEIEAVNSDNIPDIPVSALFDRYGREVSPLKRGCRSERIRLLRFSRDGLAPVRLPALSALHIAQWRDSRLAVVSAASVLRDWSLLHHVFSVAVKEWKVLHENPMTGVRKPKAPPSRDRLISELEIARLLLGFGYRSAEKARTVTARVGAAFLFAIETAMRCSEICSLRWTDISGSVAKLSMTKNGFSREVPLSVFALKIFDDLSRNSDFVFDLKPSQIGAIFRKVRARALIEDLHFHDTRHEAITRLARRLDVLDLARMVGVRDLRILMVYYNATARDIAARLG
jgi:integrase